MENRTVTSNPNGLKLKLSLYTPRRRLWGEEVQIILILDLSTRWGWVVSVTPWPGFSPRERTPGIHCTGGWVDIRAGLDTEDRGEILSPLPEIERRSTGRPACSQTLYWLSYPSHIQMDFLRIISILITDAASWQFRQGSTFFQDTRSTVMYGVKPCNYTHLKQRAPFRKTLNIRMHMCVLSTDHEFIPARNASLSAMQRSTSGSNVRYYRT
jgi:hypothetical protein